MNRYIAMDKLSLLKILLDNMKAVEELEPHFTQRREIKELESAIKELEP